MSALIWDSTTQAFKDADTPKVWDSSANAWKDAEGKIWNSTQQAWEDAWSTSHTYTVELVGSWTPSGAYVEDTRPYMMEVLGNYPKTLNVYQTGSGTFTTTSYDVRAYKWMKVVGGVLYFGQPSDYDTAGNGGIYDADNNSAIVYASGKRSTAQYIQPIGNWGFDDISGEYNISNISNIRIITSMTGTYGNWYVSTALLSLMLGN